MKFYLLAAILGSICTSALADTHCSNAQGTVQYIHSKYNRGIPPQRGDVLEGFEILLGGKVVSQSTIYLGLNPELGPISPIFSDKTTLLEEATSCGTKKVFSAKLTLEKNPTDLSELPGIEFPQSHFMICEVQFCPVP